MGLLIRSIGLRSVYVGARPLGSLWKASLWIGLVSGVMQKTGSGSGGGGSFEASREVLERFEMFWRRVGVLGLEDAHEFKPLLNVSLIFFNIYQFFLNGLIGRRGCQSFGNQKGACYRRIVGKYG
jgi:hypothetical protein